MNVEVGRGKNKIKTHAYLDTGASFCIFDPAFADQLDCEVRTGRRVRLVVGNGELITVYLHSMNLKIGDLEFAGDIGFSDELGTSINIIGRTGVMDNYMVCFDGPSQEVIWHC